MKFSRVLATALIGSAFLLGSMGSVQAQAVSAAPAAAPAMPPPVAAPAAPVKPLAERHMAKGMKCEVCHSDVTKGAIILDGKRHEICVSCHGWYDQLVKLTPPKTEEDQNPHGQHDGNLPCTECHKGHKKGVNYCGKCHLWTFEVP